MAQTAKRAGQPPHISLVAPPFRSRNVAITRELPSITNARLGQRLARLPPWPSTLGGLPRALKQQGAGPFIGDWTAKRQPKALGPSVLSRVPISG